MANPPNAVLLLPVVLALREPSPTAVFWYPVVFELPAPTPIKVLVAVPEYVITLLPDMVTVPVDVMLEAVMDPELSPRKFPAFPVIEPIFMA